MSTGSGNNVFTVASGPNPNIAVDQPIPMPDLSDLFLNPGWGPGVMLQNNRATETAKMRVGNAQRKADYLSHPWADFVARMQSGQKLSPELQVPPKPPMALELIPQSDGLVFAMPGTTPVCDIPPLPTYLGGLTVTSGLVEDQIDIGTQIGDSAYYSTGPMDTWPANRTTPPLPEGKSYPAGIYKKIPAPVGSLNIKWPDGTTGVHGGWYLRMG